ncbi:MAG TPA: ATP-binding protein [Burkholderiales bacterium]|nr:ATP-binding protein [Burkholderiales bacterium]
MARPVVAYAIALASLLVVLLLRWAFDPFLGNSLPVVMLSGAVAVSVWTGGYRPALLVVIAGYVASIYLFVEPLYSFELPSPVIVGTIAYFVMSAIVIVFGESTRRARQRWKEEQEKARTMLVKLQASEENFRRLCDAAPVLIWVSGRDRLCTWFNRQWLDFVGRPLERELGNGWVENLHPDDVSFCLEVYNKAFDNRRPFTMEYRLRNRAGEHRWVLDKGLPLQDAAGEFTGYVGSCTDIHDQKHQERALQETSQRKDEFLATLSHELRSPLAPIRNALQVLRTKEFADGDVRWSHDVIARQVTQMSRLMEDLLDVSRVSHNKLLLRIQRVDLAEIIRDAVETCGPVLQQSDHKLSVSLPESSVFLDADSARLAQVFCNLLDNAAKYSGRGTPIELRCEQRDGEVFVTVRDQGIGIAPEMTGSIFEMFSQAATALDRSNGGLGIGLALAKRVIELHGGSIGARSSGLGKGSEFIVRLPASAGKAGGADAAAATASTPRGTSQRVLVADDSRDSADSLALMLSIAGHEVRTSYGGKEAIELLETFQPSVALLDIGMPGISGLAVCGHIRTQPWGKRVTLIAQTGWGRDDDRQMTQKAGFDHHLVKPVDPNALLKIIEELG